MSDRQLASTRLCGEDLSFWWLDSPMQPTTMAMLMLLDSSPHPKLLRRAFARTISVVPRLSERVADAPLGLTLPHWEPDPTFDLDYQLRRRTLSPTHDLDDLFAEISRDYERPFDRSRPLWEAYVYDNVGPDRQSALFFKLHHAVADGVGGNAIFASLTDSDRDVTGTELKALNGHAYVSDAIRPAPWGPQPSFGSRILDAVRDRVALDLERVGAVAGAVRNAVLHPNQIARALTALRSLGESVRFDSHSPFRSNCGRSRKLAACTLPFREVHRLKHDLQGSMIDVILTVMARAMGKWHESRGATEVTELLTLVPIAMRKPEEWTGAGVVGNVASGILVPLPIRIADPLLAYHEIRVRMNHKKADPASGASPVIAEILSVLPRQFLTWMAEATFSNLDFIVTNVPGILVPRFLAGTEILAAYPFAPVAKNSPASIALYGYRELLHIGIDADATILAETDRFAAMIRESFEELRAAAIEERMAV
jgi:diacylglycerol O-acyltransferase